MEKLNRAAAGGLSGRDHLEQRSRLKLQLQDLAPIASVLIIDDATFDGDVLASALRQVLGSSVVISQVRTMRGIAKAVADVRPDVIFLDDRLDERGAAEVSLKLIRAAGHCRPVIIVSGLLTRARQIELGKLGAGDVVHKDDRNAVRLTEAILKVMSPTQSPG